MAELRVAGHVEIEEAIVLANAEESLVLRLIVCTEKIKLDCWETLRNENGLGDGHFGTFEEERTLDGNVSGMRERRIGLFSKPDMQLSTSLYASGLGPLVAVTASIYSIILRCIQIPQVPSYFHRRLRGQNLRDGFEMA